MVFSLGNNNAQSASFFSSSSSSSCEEEEDVEGRVEVTVQRLDGVAWVDSSGRKGNSPKKCHELPHLTATVSFSGSAEDMQIGSSTVCGLTGQLLVESDPINLDCAFQSTSNPASSSSSPDPLIPEDQAKDAVWLTAQWPEDVVVTTVGTTTPQPHQAGCSNHSTVTASTSTISSTTAGTTSTVTVVQPHVRMHFPGAQADPRLPKPCLVQSNRGSKIVKASHDQGVIAAAAACGHKKTNSNAGLETTGTASTDFTSLSEGCTPPLSPSSSSGQEQFLNHGSPTTPPPTTTKISGMEELLYHQQNQNGNDAAAAIAMTRGESAFWSHSGNAMPEILELYIRLRCHDSSQNFADTNLWEGVSFLVLFGQEDDKGSHIIDLPVRRPFLSVDPADSEDDLCFRHVGQDASPADGPRLLLTSQARLRLKVTIIPDKLRRNKRSGNSSIGPQHNAQPLMATSIDAPNQDSSVEVSLTRSTLEAKLKPLMDKIRENELLALQQWQAQKRAMDVHVPIPLNNNPNKENEKKSYCYYPARGPHYANQDDGCDNVNNNGNDSVFANMIWSWDHVVNLITMPCGSCDGRFSSAVVDPGNDKDGILLEGGRGNSPLVFDLDAANFQDDSSTIATRESWGI